MGNASTSQEQFAPSHSGTQGIDRGSTSWPAVGSEERKRESLVHGVFMSVVTSGIVSGLFASWSYLCSPADISGEWDVLVHTTQTGYSDYQGLRTRYRIHLESLADGVLTGRGEKVAHRKAGSEWYEYPPKNRRVVKVSGKVEGQLFHPDAALLTINERGRDDDAREVYSVLKLRGQSAGQWEGTYITNAANSRGSASLTRPSKNP